MGRRLFKKKLKRTLLLKKFLLWQVFCLDSSKTWSLVLEVFHLVIDSTLVFFLGKVFENLFFINSPMAYGVILSLSKLISCHNLSWKLLPKGHLPTLCQVKLPIQQVKLPHDFYLHLFLIKNLFCLLFWPLEIYKGTTSFPLSFASKQVSLASP